jgi:hypothetical protein
VDFQPRAFRVLEASNDLEEVPSRGIPFGTKHLVKRLDVKLGVLRHFAKADCCVDVIAKKFLPEGQFGRKKTVDCRGQKAFSESGIASGARLNRIPKISR